MKRSNLPPLVSPRLEDARPRLRSFGLVLLLGFLGVELALALWSVVRAPDILGRDDNPRLIAAEQRIRRGQIVDTNNEVLAESINQNDSLRRYYPDAAAGPAVGYYSLRHGTSGIEAGYDDVLRGDSANAWTDYWQKEVLHLPSEGHDLRLTLDAQWQRAADALMGERTGAVILVSVPDVAIRAMVSHPSYDPNTLDERFELLSDDERAPLLNRATQGQYQPGLILQPFILTKALEHRIAQFGEVIGDAAASIAVDGQVVGCEEDPPAEATWPDVLRARCPGPMAALGSALGAGRLQSAFLELGLTTVPNVPIAAEASDDASITDPRLAAVGQDQLTVSPLQILLAWVALANGGVLSDAQLVGAVSTKVGAWQPVTADGSVARVVPDSLATDILSALTKENGLVEHSSRVLSGPQGTTNSWYLGLAPAAAPRYAVAVVVEDSGEADEAVTVGRSLLRHVLNPVGTP